MSELKELGAGEAEFLLVPPGHRAALEAAGVPYAEAWSAALPERGLLVVKGPRLETWELDHLAAFMSERGFDYLVMGLAEGQDLVQSLALLSDEEFQGLLRQERRRRRQ